MNSLHKTFFAVSIFLLCPAIAFAQSGEDVRDTVGSSIVVADDKNVHDLVGYFCSIALMKKRLF